MNADVNLVVEDIIQNKNKMISANVNVEKERQNIAYAKKHSSNPPPPPSKGGVRQNGGGGGLSRNGGGLPYYIEVFLETPHDAA